MDIVDYIAVGHVNGKPYELNKKSVCLEAATG